MITKFLMKCLMKCYEILTREKLVEISSSTRRSLINSSKSWTSDEYKDYYCKYVENGHEVYQVITKTYYEKFKGISKIRKTYQFANESYIPFGYPADKVIILGKSVDQLTRLKYENQKQKRKIMNQRSELKMQQAAVVFWSKSFSRKSKEFDDFRNKAITKEDISKCFETASSNPIIGLTSPNEKERDLVGFLIQELKK